MCHVIYGWGVLVCFRFAFICPVFFLTLFVTYLLYIYIYVFAVFNLIAFMHRSVFVVLNCIMCLVLVQCVVWFVVCQRCFCVVLLLLCLLVSCLLGFVVYLCLTLAFEGGVYFVWFACVL